MQCCGQGKGPTTAKKKATQTFEGYEPVTQPWQHGRTWAHTLTLQPSPSDAKRSCP